MSLQQNMTRIRQSIPQGYFLGRLSAGVGPVEAIDPASLASHIVSTGIAAGSSGSGQAWTAGNVSSLGTIANGVTLTINAGALTANTPENAMAELSIDVATATTLPAYTYSNGVNGVGATITGSSNGVLDSNALDSVPPAIGMLVLVWLEVDDNAPYNGLYTVTATGSASTPYVLTRTPTQDNEFAAVYGSYLTTYAGSNYFNSLFLSNNLAPLTIGTDPLAWVPYPTAGSGISIIGGRINAQWAAGEITVLGTVSGGATLYTSGSELLCTIPADKWGPAAVTALGTIANEATLAISSGTLTCTIPADKWGPAAVTALGTVAGQGTLSVSSGTLICNTPTSGSTLPTYTIPTCGVLSSSTDAGAFATKGNLMTPHDTITVSQLFANYFVNGTSGAQLQASICNVGTSLTVGGTLAQSDTVTYGTLTTGRMLTFDFSPAVTLLPGVEYAMLVTLLNGTTTTALALTQSSTLTFGMPGFYNKSTDASGYGVHFAGTTIATGDTLLTNSTTLFNIGLAYGATL